MTKNINITLDQLKRFLDQPYHNRFVMLESAVQPLKETLASNIFTNHNDTKKIATKKELQVLIARGGKSHRPARPRRAKRYNNEYLKRKLKYMGETRPHVYENYGFLNGTQILFSGETLTVRATPIMQRGSNYLAIHERNRSVLKLLWLRSWQHVFTNMVEALANEARKP